MLNLIGGVLRKVVTIGGSSVAEIVLQQGTKRFSIDSIGWLKILKGAGVATIGGPVVGGILYGIVSDLGFLVALEGRDTLSLLVVLLFGVVGSVLANVVRKWLTRHPEIAAVLDEALAKNDGS